MNETQDFLKNLSDDEVEFLVRLGNELASRRPEISSFDRFRVSGQVQWIVDRDGPQPQKSDVAKRSYLDYIMCYVNLKACLDIRKKYSGSPNLRLPGADAVCKDILVKDGLWGLDDPDLCVARAKAIRESLAPAMGLRRKRSIKQLRDDIIVEGYMAGRTHREIAAELDANADLAGDPLLRKWTDADALFVGTWSEALEHPQVGPRTRCLFSKIWQRSKNRS